MGVLFFEDSRGNMRLVNAEVSADNIYPEMIGYIKKLNPNFHVYYVRCWSLDENAIKFDVGSHTEFFIFKHSCCANCKHFLGGGDFGTCCSKDYGLHYEDNICEKWVDSN